MRPRLGSGRTCLAHLNGMCIIVDAFASRFNSFLPRATRGRLPKPRTPSLSAVGTSPSAPGVAAPTVKPSSPTPPHPAQPLCCQGIVDTPLAVSVPYWNKLLCASLVAREVDFIHLPDSDAGDELALFAVDFGSHAG